MEHKGQTVRINQRAVQLYQLTTLVAGQFSLQEALDKLAEAAVKITGVKACSIRLLDEERDAMEMRSTYGLSEEYRNKGAVTRDDPVIRAAFSGRAVAVEDMRRDRRIRFRQAIIKEGIVSQLTVAMKFRNKPIGVLRLYSRQVKRFNKDDVALARAVASQCAVAITNARLYSQAIEGSKMAEQMRLAGVIQRRMIPEKAPLVPGLDVAATYIPCFDVGGDFYDFLQLGDSRLAVAMADVIGKGVPAALMMSLFRGAVRAYADVQGDGHSIQAIIEKLNGLACHECRDGEFVTLAYAVVDAQAMTMEYCNCGHEPPVLIRGGKIVELNAGGLVLGVDKRAGYDVEKVQLADGDCVLFFTDGLTDAINFEGQMWGRERLYEIARQLNHGSAEEGVSNILRYRRRFVGLAHQVDDTSIVAVKIDRRAEPSFMKRLKV